LVEIYAQELKEFRAIEKIQSDGLRKFLLFYLNKTASQLLIRINKCSDIRGNKGMFTELIKNSAVLIALSVLFGLLSRKRISGLPAYKIVEGLLYGGIAIVAMEMTVYHPAGYIYDGRSIVIALAGFLGGSITAGISVAIAWIYRIYLGGSGVWVGTLTMLISAMIGLLFRYLVSLRKLPKF